jgi:hypothetical protein
MNEGKKVEKSFVDGAVIAKKKVLRSMKKSSKQDSEQAFKFFM